MQKAYASSQVEKLTGRFSCVDTVASASTGGWGQSLRSISRPTPLVSPAFPTVRETLPSVHVRMLPRVRRRHVPIAHGFDEPPEAPDGHEVLVEPKTAHGGGIGEVGRPGSRVLVGPKEGSAFDEQARAAALLVFPAVRQTGASRCTTRHRGCVGDVRSVAYGGRLRGRPIAAFTGPARPGASRPSVPYFVRSRREAGGLLRGSLRTRRPKNRPKRGDIFASEICFSASETCS
jgi:hypothetical protein